jgi:hypothetical protein
MSPPEHDVAVVIGEEELLAVLPRDPPDRREPRGLLVEMRPHGGGDDLGHRSAETHGQEEEELRTGHQGSKVGIARSAPDARPSPPERL